MVSREDPPSLAVLVAEERTLQAMGKASGVFADIYWTV